MGFFSPNGQISSPSSSSTSHLLPSLSCCKYPQQWTDPTSALRSTQSCAETTSHVQTAQAGLRKHQQIIKGPFQSKKLSRTEAGGPHEATISYSGPRGGQRAARPPAKGMRLPPGPDSPQNSAWIPRFEHSDCNAHRQTPCWSACSASPAHSPEERHLISAAPKVSRKRPEKMDCNITT